MTLDEFDNTRFTANMTAIYHGDNEKHPIVAHERGGKLELKEWTHRYRFKMDLPNFVPRVGNILTGTVQVSREYSDDEVEALAKEMSHGIFNNAKLVEVRLVEVRNTPTPSNA